MNFSRTWLIMRTELIHLLRDPVALIIALFMPLFMLFLFSYSLCYQLREMPLAVFDMDRSQASKDYIKNIDSTSYFHIQRYLTSYDESVHFLDTGKIKAVIVIPSNFERRIAENLPANIQTLVDGSFVNSAQFIINYISGINASYSAKLATEFMNKTGAFIDVEPVKMPVRSWFNQSLRDFTFIITGLFTVVIMGFIPILSALAIVREKESGSIQQIFVSPVKAHEYIAGKMIPYVLFLGIDNFLVILFGIWFFELPFRGNPLMLFIATMLFVFATVGLGFFISTLTRNQLTAMLLAIVFTLMPAFIFGDAISPITSMPEGWKLYSCLFPARFFTGVSRAILLKGASFASYWQDALSLVLYCFAIFSISAWRVKNSKIT